MVPFRRKKLKMKLVILLLNTAFATFGGYKGYNIINMYYIIRLEIINYRGCELEVCNYFSNNGNAEDTRSSIRNHR